MRQSYNITLNVRQNGNKSFIVLTLLVTSNIPTNLRGNTSNIAETLTMFGCLDSSYKQFQRFGRDPFYLHVCQLFIFWNIEHFVCKLKNKWIELNMFCSIEYHNWNGMCITGTSKSINYQLEEQSNGRYFCASNVSWYLYLIVPLYYLYYSAYIPVLDCQQHCVWIWQQWIFQVHSNSDL